MVITSVPANSNNFMVGRQGNTPSIVVLHWIVGTLQSADITFQNPLSIVSAHYGVGGTKVHQYVQEKDTAYANGDWNTNLKAISIEHEGGPTIEISHDTYMTSAVLLADVCKRYGIPLDRAHVKKHSEIKATQCPGTLNVDLLITMAKAINAPVPTPPTTPNITIQEVKNAYQGVCGVQPTQDEINFRIKENKPQQEVINDLLKNDSRARVKWLKEWGITDTAELQKQLDQLSAKVLKAKEALA